MNEESKVILTDEEVDQIVDTANAVNEDNESIKKLHEAKDRDIDELLDSDEESKDVALTINPVTGKPEGVSVVQTGYGLDKDTDLFDDFLDAETDVSDVDFTDKNVKDALASSVQKNNISDIDIAAVQELLNKKNKKGTIKYDDLPAFLKKNIDSTVKEGLKYGYTRSQIGMAKNMMANDIVERIYTTMLSEKISEVSVDLETSIKNLVSKEYKDINAAQMKQQSYIYMKKMPELAETKFKDDPEKKALLYAVSEGYKEALSLDKMYSAYSKGGKQMKVRKIDIEKLHKLIRDFEAKYENSTFTIRDISYGADILERHVNPRFDKNTIKAFIAVFCKYTQNMKPSKVAEHTFMYYFINNILALDIPTTDKDVIKYNEEFIGNVNHFLSLINDRINKQ